MDDASDDVRTTRDSSRYRAAASWLVANTPVGTRVFATDWDDFPELFFWDTNNAYLNGLDPTYMYLEDGPLYLQWRSITRGRIEMPGASIRDPVRLRLGLHRHRPWAVLEERGGRS